MKQFLIMVLLFTVSGLAQADEDAPKPSDKSQVGVYDSRVVAYAHFWSDAHQKKLNKFVAEPKTAKESGDKKKFEDLGKVLSDHQKQVHRQTFSSVSVDDILEEIKDRLPEIKKQAGVSELLSKWDEKKLEQHKTAEKVDITDKLVSEFIKPTEEQNIIIESLKKAKPVPPDQAEKIDD